MRRNNENYFEFFEAFYGLILLKCIKTLLGHLKLANLSFSFFNSFTQNINHSSYRLSPIIA